VEEELRWNSAIDAANLTADVRNGIVTLAGFVRSFNQK